ncbi:MAG: TetR/AcrR family transcriptional regulator [Tepidanaerobacteraceae bacterium]|jgi:AcrR family transcriptional regulator|nr:TetR/AcrR family transcriptional regulator [Tepidanaerobacteraceae bacterium]
MQTLKEEVRNNICRAAVDEFWKKGFCNASMRAIAKNAGITVGNLYRYFKDKEDLFNAVIFETHARLIRYVKHNIGLMMNRPGKSFFEHMADTILAIRKENLRELIILFEGSRGTRYENVKEEVINMVEKFVNDEYLPGIKGFTKGLDPFISHVIASGFIEGLIMINKRYDDSCQLRRAISQFINFYFQNSI